MDFLTVGQKINILRTNGSVQNVHIVKLNKSNLTVITEWNELSETKGKEVTLESIISLNPEIFHSNAMTQIQNQILREQTLPFNAETEPTAQPDTVTRISNNTETNSRRLSSACKTAGLNTVKAADPHPEPRKLSPAKIGIRRKTSPLITRPTAQITPTSVRTNARTARHCETLRSAGGGFERSNRHTTVTTTEPSCSFVVERLLAMKEQHREKQSAKQAKQNKESESPELSAGQREIAKMISDYQQTLEMVPLQNIQINEFESPQISVCVRKRPLNKKERSLNEIDIVSVTRKDLLMVHEPRNKVDLTRFLENHKFRFDYAFDEECDNALIYQYTARPLVRTIFDGGNATCFAYGQTGSGKTHTMGGEFHGKVQRCENGIYALAARDVFSTLQRPAYRALNLSVLCSFFEIYGGKVFDLLTPDKRQLRVLEDGRQQVQVVGLTETLVENETDVQRLIQLGSHVRTSGQTSANSKSSRSHAIFQIVLRVKGARDFHGKFSIIDLAGNERGADTSCATRQTRIEGAEINKSLLALKECIRALSRNSPHLPFRGATLTQVLRDSFIGSEKNKTCMIAMISPGLNCCENTLNTLRYADRVKELVANDLLAPRLLSGGRQRDKIRVDEWQTSVYIPEECNTVMQAEDANMSHFEGTEPNRSSSDNESAIYGQLVKPLATAVNDLQAVGEQVLSHNLHFNDMVAQIAIELEGFDATSNQDNFDFTKTRPMFNCLCEIDKMTAAVSADLREKMFKTLMLANAVYKPI